MQEAVGGEALSTPLIGGRVTLSLCVWREWGTGRIPHPPEKRCGTGGAAGVARPVQGYTIPVCKDNKKKQHDAQNREENDVFEDERYDMSEFLPKFAPVYPRRVSLSLRPMPATARSDARRGEGDGACVKKREGHGLLGVTAFGG